MERVYLGLGSNMGDRQGNIKRACELLAGSRLLTGMRISSIYETDPWGPVPQGPFLNCVLSACTAVSGPELLELALRVEAEIGRVRDVHWGPRVIDIDVLLIGEERINLPQLQVPHPRMWERAFVLVPLADLAPDMSAPGGTPLARYILTLPDIEGVRQVKPDPQGLFGPVQNKWDDNSCE